MGRISIFLLLFFLSGCTSNNVKTVCVKNICVRAEVVDSDPKRTQGLMFRENLAANQGMLFIFEAEARYAFWMKNMKFPLDIIWISQDKRIVDIKTEVPPCRESCETITPQAKAKYVLEVNSDFTDKNQLKIGDRVSF